MTTSGQPSAGGQTSALFHTVRKMAYLTPQAQPLYPATHQALRSAFLEVGAGALNSVVVAIVHSDDDVAYYQKHFAEHTVLLLSERAELDGDEVLTFDRINPKEQLLVVLSADFSYALLAHELNDPAGLEPLLQRVGTLQLHRAIDVMTALTTVLKLAYDQDHGLGVRLEQVIARLLTNQAPRYVKVDDPVELEHYMGVLKHLADLGDAREDHDPLVSDRLASLTMLVATRLGATGLQQEALQRTLKLLDMDPFNTLSAAGRRTNSPELLLELTGTILGRYENTDGSGRPQGLEHKSITLGARILRIVQDYLRAGSDTDALKLLRDQVETVYDPKVFMALSQVERDAALDNARPTLTGVASGEDLFGVLQMAQTLSRSGTLVFDSFSGKHQLRGWIGLEQGTITGIETKNESGEEALIDIITWGTGRFSLFGIEAVMLEPKQRGTSELLMLSATYLDNLRSLQELGFQTAVPIRLLRSGTPAAFDDLFKILKQGVSFETLFDQGYERRWLIDGLAHLARERWIGFKPPENVNRAESSG